MTDPSQMLVEINARRSKFIFRSLILLLIIAVGSFAYFYRSIPKEARDKLIGKSNAAKKLVYTATPPGLDEKSNEDVLAGLKEGATPEVYTSRLEEEFVKSKDEIKKLRVEINKLNHKIEKQKKLIEKILK